MDEQQELQRQKLADKIRRVVDQVWAEFDTDEPNWGPLEAALPIEELAGFMWMYRDELDGTPIEVYRHAITRHWLHIGHDGTAYRWSNRRGYRPMPRDEAIKNVFEGLEESGYTRDSSGAEYLDERDRLAAEHGWTVIG